MIIRSFSKQDTSIIKGIAILCICLHNFLHWIPPYTGENEFYFSSKCINNFFNGIASQPSELINLLFTFLGHYGVQIFIFISGYGLTISMLKHHKTWLNFIVDRLKKLYPLLITAIIFYILFRIFMYSKLPTENQIRELGYKLLFIHTLLPYQGLSVNGPWWFFGLIFQLYLVFPAIFYLLKKYNIKAFVVILLISYIWTYASLYFLPNIAEVYYFQNFPAHIPEFCFGILLALNKDKKLNNILFFIALTLFCLGNFYKVFFPFTFLSITIIFIFTYQFLKNIKIRKTLLKRFLIYFGNISMTLFAVHGFLRDPFVNLANNQLNTPLGHIIAAILFLVATTIIAFAANHVYEGLLCLFNKIKSPKNNKTSIIVSRILQISLIICTLNILIYFMRSNNFDNVKKYSDYTFLETVNVDKTKEYSDITKININKKDKKLKIEGSLDIKKEKDAKNPILVLDIKGILWQELKLSEISNNTSYFSTYTFDFEYACPFIRNLKNKDIKLYFWNKDKNNFEYKNVNFSISTK